MGRRYPAIVHLWKSSWAEFVPFLEYDVEIRRVICTTNAIYIGREAAAEDVGTALGVSSGDEVIARRKMFWANDVPVRIATSYFRLDVAESTRLDQDGFVLPTLQAALEDMGHTFGRAFETLIARPATPAEAELLDVADEWVVRILRVSVNTDDLPVHALETVCAATRHIFPITQADGPDQF